MAKPGPKPGAKRTTKAAKSTQASPPFVLATEATTEEQPADDPALQADQAVNVPDAPLAATPEGDKGPASKPAKAKQEPAPVLSAADRENFDKLSGQPLRDLAHKRGIAFSTLCNMSDEKIRMQLRYITYRQYEDDAVD
jgi:hypothetical protein